MVLRLCSNDATSNGPALYATDPDWTESTITWQNRPARLGAPLGDLGSISAGRWYEFDVTGVVTGPGTYSFELAATSTDGVHFRSREASSNRPELMIVPGGPGTRAAGSNSS
jgi:hypothetical protein